jgi:hypothetical protein
MKRVVFANEQVLAYDGGKVAAGLFLPVAQPKI